MIVSSAYNRRNIFKNTISESSKWCSVHSIPTTLFSVKKSSMSFKNKLNKRGERFSPCRTPILLMKKSVVLLLTRTHDLIFLYILCITRKHLPFILYLDILSYKPALHTLSNACFRSIKLQNKLRLLLQTISMRLCKMKILSVVLYPFLNPAWQFLIISCSST